MFFVQSMQTSAMVTRFITLIAAFFCFPTNFANQYDDLWINYAVCAHKINPYSPSIIQLIFSPQVTTHPSYQHFTLPNLFIWDPINQLSQHYPECNQCGQKFKTKCYTTYATRAPRPIIHSEGPLLLISAVYACPSRHAELMATSELYMESLHPLVRHSFPFILTRHNGIHNNVLSNLEQSVINGVGINTFSTMLVDSWEVTYGHQETQFIEWQSLHNIAENIQDFPPFTQKVDTYRQYLTDLYIDEFHSKKLYWHYCFNLLKHNGILTVDHTYKQASKILNYTTFPLLSLNSSLCYDIFRICHCVFNFYQTL